MKIFDSIKYFRVEYELIQNVKKLRLERGWSQRVLSAKMKFVESMVGKVESIDQEDKYTLRHLNILFKVFNFTSIYDFFPNGLPEDEEIIIRYKKIPKVKKDGTLSKFTEPEIVEIIIVE